LNAVRALVTALLAAVLLSPPPASALELGDSRILSGIGEPLDLEIAVLQATPEELDNLTPQLPARSRPPVMATATVELERPASGEPRVRVRTRDPVNVSALTFLMVADWGRGRALRAYTVLVKEKPSTPVQSPSSLTTSSNDANSSAASTQTAASTQVVRSTRVEQGSPVPRAPVEAETVIPAANAAPAPTAGKDTNAVTRAVRRSETLMSISREWSARTGATLAQTMLGIYRANPEAFRNGMGDMTVGSTLKLPDAAALRAVSTAEANSEVGRQLGIWGQTVPPAAPAAKPAPTAKPAPVAKPAPAAKPAPTAKPASALTLPPAKPSAAPSTPVAPTARAVAPVAAVVVPPDAVAKDPAFKSLEARVLQAERELAALQTRLRQIEEVKVAPPPAVAPAPAALIFNDPAATPPASGTEGAAPAARPADSAADPAAPGAAPSATLAASGPKVPVLPAAPPFTPAPSLQQRALELTQRYGGALAGVGGALVLGMAALVIVRRRRAAVEAASAEPRPEMTFDLPPIKSSRAEPKDLEDVLMRPGTGGAAAATLATPETRVTPPPLPDDREGNPPPIDETGSMIDLARAYIEMGNFDSAMMELQTALRTGDEAQRAEALRLLDSLPKS
jgi:pilus assembly protein FimV